MKEKDKKLLTEKEKKKKIDSPWSLRTPKQLDPLRKRLNSLRNRTRNTTRIADPKMAILKQIWMILMPSEICKGKQRSGSF
jgi:hypothetical protein